MAGHNKWSKIRHRKAVVDKRRSKAWTMCSRAIISVVRQAGPDPTFNFALRQALDDARYHNVPKDNIERAIKKGAGTGAGDNYEPIRYEGYGPGGVAVIVEAFTDNRTRTAADVRLIFSRFSGKLGTTGCVSHQFEHKGRIELTSETLSEEQIMEAALNAGAEDVRSAGENTWEIITDPTQFTSVRAKLEAAGLKPGDNGLEMLPTTTVAIAGEQAKELLELVEAMEDNEDVKKVFTNADIADDVMESLS
jgi:YebC/PmpR family DNA-binding regulatory protein